MAFGSSRRTATLLKGCLVPRVAPGQRGNKATAGEGSSAATGAATGSAPPSGTDYEGVFRSRAARTWEAVGRHAGGIGLFAVALAATYAIAERYCSLVNLQNQVQAARESRLEFEAAAKLEIEQADQDFKLLREQLDEEVKLVSEQCDNDLKLVREQIDKEVKLVSEQCDNDLKLVREQIDKEVKLIREQGDKEVKLIREQGELKMAAVRAAVRAEVAKPKGGLGKSEVQLAEESKEAKQSQ